MALVDKDHPIKREQVVGLNSDGLAIKVESSESVDVAIKDEKDETTGAENAGPLVGEIKAEDASVDVVIKNEKDEIVDATSVGNLD